ncbi:MAG: PIN domain-containing protein [Acidobacteriota bacterium]
MTTTFADTSGLYALLVAEDARHEAARQALRTLQEQGAGLVTTSFVLQETIALLQARAGVAAVRTFHQFVIPALDVIWVDEPLYRRAIAALVAADRRAVSLTDWTSFEVMRASQITRAFAFDPHFAEQGFTTV